MWNVTGKRCPSRRMNHLWQGLAILKGRCHNCCPAKDHSIYLLGTRPQTMAASVSDPRYYVWLIFSFCQLARSISLYNIAPGIELRLPPHPLLCYAPLSPYMPFLASWCYYHRYLLGMIRKPETRDIPRTAEFSHNEGFAASGCALGAPIPDDLGRHL